MLRPGRMATETTESTEPRSPTPEVVFPPSPRKGGGVKGKESSGGWVGVRAFSGFRG